jgi:hypothetical protein
MHTNPFFPLTADSYACAPSTKTSASPEIDSGAALRANAISASRLAIMYCATGAILGYEVLAFCADTSRAVLNMKTITTAAVKPGDVTLTSRARFIDFSSATALSFGRGTLDHILGPVLFIANRVYSLGIPGSVWAPTPFCRVFCG